MNIFNVIGILWGISEIVLNRLFRSGKVDKKNQDKGSLGFIWITIVVALSASIIFSEIISMPISTHKVIPYAGLALIILGMILRFYSIWALGKYFTVDVTIRNQHQIKQDGIYGIIRHPSYSGAILSFIGFGIAQNNWLSFITITVLISIVFLYRIKIEEKALVNHFGAEYSNYMKTTARLIPWVY